VRDLSGMLASVLRDFVATPVHEMVTRLVLADVGRLDDVALLDPRLAVCVDVDEPRILLRVAENVTVLDPTLDDQEIIVEVASHLQDRVMDELNRPWPETGVGAPRVLEPFLGPDRTAVWGDRRSGTPFCRVGALQEHR